jgi:UDP-2,3-diacylglucosamine hydrolase
MTGYSPGDRPPVKGLDPRPGSPETLFISDLHLSAERPAAIALFLDFLAERAARASRLYILGDLFDVWIGDDDDTPPYPEIRAALGRLTRGGTACGLMRGNRDLLLGRAFCRETGCDLLRDLTLTEFDGVKTLLMHGDLLCTDDVDYLRFRRWVRNPLVMRLFLWKSLASRRAIADDYRRKSRTAKAGKSSQIMDANPVAVAGYLARFGATRLIHGHTHRPADHALALGETSGQRLVLAEWTDTGGEVLTHRDGTWQREAVRPLPDQPRSAG